MVRDIEREILPLCREENLGVVPWSPLDGGFLSGKYRREGPPPGTRIAQAGKDWEESWHRRSTEKNFRILDVIGKIASSRGKSYAQVALSWIKDQPGVTSPIIGARTMEQLKDNLGSIGWKLTREERETLDRVSRLEEAYPYRFIGEHARKTRLGE